MSLNHKMGEAHENFLVRLLGGRKSRGSGNQWRDQMDGRHDRMSQRFAFAWDGKSTLAKSQSISREMWAKAREQAGGERPLLAVRFYDTEKLDVGEDLVVLSIHDFVEMLEAANDEQPLRIITYTIPDLYVGNGKEALAAIVIWPTGQVQRHAEVTIDRPPPRSIVLGRPVEPSDPIRVTINGKQYFGPVVVSNEATAWTFEAGE